MGPQLRVTGTVIGVVEHRNVSFPLQGQLEDGSTFSYDVQKMFLLQIDTMEAPAVFVGASESILASFEIISGDSPVVKIFLKDDEPYTNPIPGIFIASKEFPKELIR